MQVRIAHGHRILIAGLLLLASGAAIWLMGGFGGADDAVAPWTRFIAWIFTQQKAFHRELTEALGTLSREGSVAAAGVLILASFLYGVFHAAGPGHGKAIVSTYLLTHREQLRRGLALAVASSLFQGLVAVVLVHGLITLAGWLPREANVAVDWSERVSFGLVGLMGAFLIYRAGRRIYGRRMTARNPDNAQGTAHDHAHHHDHGDNACCDHAHGPNAAQIARATDLKTAIGIILSVGLRPCTGAVLVLVLAKALGMALAGIGAVFAMSVGTAVTVAGLAYFAVRFRDWVGANLTGGGAGWHIVGDLVGIAGGLVLAALGGSLLMASFAPAHPLGI